MKTFRFKRFEKKNYSAYNSMHKIVSIGVVSIMTLATSVNKTSNAQTVNTDSVAMYGTLQEVIVNDELASPMNQEGKIITVITTQDIENLKPQSIAELLSYATTIDIQTRGGHGVQSDISIRGGNFDQTAILLNGINITNPHTGHYSLDIPVNISDIERIEIIKGPSAIIYGAGAFSGGINIITKKNINQELNITIEGGEHGFFNGEIAGAKTYKNIENYLSLGAKTSNGYIANSEYNIFNALYQNRINLANNNKLDFQIGYNKKDYGANTFYSAKYPNQYEKTSSFITSLKGIFNLCDNFSIVPSAYYTLHTDEFELIKDVSNPNYHLSNVFGNNVSFAYTYKNFRLNFGSDVRYEEILSSVLGDIWPLHGEHYNHHKDRINFSYFVQGNYSYKNLLLTLGVMTFQNTSFHQGILDFYPSINVNYSFNRNWEIYAAYNTSSRLPSFTELYYSDAVHAANPNLKQEKSTDFELGTKNKNHIAITSLNLYYMKGENMIDWMKESASDPLWQSRNINNLNKYGAELDSKIFLAEVMPFLHRASTLRLSYSWMHQEQGKIDYISQYALNYLKHKVTAELSLPLFSKLTLNTAVKYCVREGSYINYENNPSGEETSYDPFFTMDCNLNYSFRQFNFYINCTNILNADYFDIGNIPQPGRWIIGGIKFSI
ncbi:MAG: TonB-dependent receptor [Bacteroidales bacterium]|nr:TonB-dependent receptor [Bacteroidales bacterium]